jgi:hypothetical protein
VEKATFLSLGMEANSFIKKPHCSRCVWNDLHKEAVGPEGQILLTDCSVGTKHFRSGFSVVLFTGRSIIHLSKLSKAYNTIGQNASKKF